MANLNWGGGTDSAAQKAENREIWRRTVRNGVLTWIRARGMAASDEN